jgi:predicted CoA-binding protein
MNPKETFKTVETVLVIDWPTKDVPESLTMAGFHVVVRGGPGPEDYLVYAWNNGKIVTRHLGRAPDRADLIFSHRPFSELVEIIATAKELHAKIIWTQSGVSATGVDDPKGCWIPEKELQSARDLVESSGLNYNTEPYIGDFAREIRESRRLTSNDLVASADPHR